MNKEEYGKYQFDCIRQDCGDMIGFNPFLNQLPCQIGESKIGHEQPYLVINGVRRDIRSSRFGSSLYPILSFEKGNLNIFMGLTNFLHKLIPHGVTRSFKSHVRREVLCDSKRNGIGGKDQGVIVYELSHFEPFYLLRMSFDYANLLGFA